MMWHMIWSSLFNRWLHGLNNTPALEEIVPNTQQCLDDCLTVLSRRLHFSIARTFCLEAIFRERLKWLYGLDLIMLPQQATSDRPPHLISGGRQRNHFSICGQEGGEGVIHGNNSNGWTISEPVLKAEQKTSLKAFVFEEQERRENMKKICRLSFEKKKKKIEKHTRMISLCSIVWFLGLSNSFGFPALFHQRCS